MSYTPPPEMSDGMKAQIRTWWPMLIGHVAAVGAAWLADRVGVRIDGAIAFEAVGFGLSGLIYSAGKWMEDRPKHWVRVAGRWLLSAGRNLGKPVYTPKPAPGAVRPGSGPPPVSTERWPDNEPRERY